MSWQDDKSYDFESYPEIKMKTIVCHVGSRREYAVPAVFAREEILERFYTDMCGTNGLGRLAKPLSYAVPFLRESLISLSYRVPPQAVVKRTVAFDLFGLEIRRRMRGASPTEMIRHWERLFEIFGQKIISKGFGEAELLYSLMGEAGPALMEASRQGLRTAADVYIAPSWDRLIAREYQRFPEWGEKPVTFTDAMGKGFRAYSHMLEGTQLFVCPSNFVRDDLILNFGVCAKRAVVVPYAVAPRWFELQTRPERGRILFLGTAELRKGIHHFAMAAQKLKAQGDSYEFIVAGGVDPRIRQKGEAMGLTFLGRVPKIQMPLELARADVVVLPSIAEGSAGATYEALGAGIPIVASAATGAVARDGIEGVIMAEPNATEIAEAIGKIVSDRGLRERMSSSARNRAREYSWDKFGERLMSVLMSEK